MRDLLAGADFDVDGIDPAAYRAAAADYESAAVSLENAAAELCA